MMNNTVILLLGKEASCPLSFRLSIPVSDPALLLLPPWSFPEPGGLDLSHSRGPNRAQHWGSFVQHMTEKDYHPHGSQFSFMIGVALIVTITHCLLYVNTM